MGHIIFCILHFACFIFGFIGLIITIPLHIIYCAVKANKPTEEKDVVCPLCDRMISPDSVSCKYCDADLRKCILK